MDLVPEDPVPAPPIAHTAGVTATVPQNVCFVESNPCFFHHPDVAVAWDRQTPMERMQMLEIEGQRLLSHREVSLLESWQGVRF